MKLQYLRPLGTFVLSAALLLGPALASAEIVTTEQLTAQHGAASDRDKIQAVLDRADAAGQLQVLGVDRDSAEKRVSSLSDAEVHTLVGKIDSLPAGGNLGGFTDQQLIIILLIVILVAIIASS